MTGSNTQLREIATRTLLSGAMCVLMYGYLAAQDIRGYDIGSADDSFLSEIRSAQSSGTGFSGLPLLDCSVEYLRRSEGKDVVYRRGPVDLQQFGTTIGRTTVSDDGGAPASAESPASFTGGILVDLPRVGEAETASGYVGERYRYLIRIALLPLDYEGQLLHARLFMERALVTVEGGSIDILKNEVFSREVELQGNVPLKFDLPPWETADAEGAIVPHGLQESVLLTLEIPRYFSLSQNEPNPFSSSTVLRYSVPTDSYVKLKISIQGEETVLEEGRKSAGNYELQWKPASVADERVTASLAATDDHGTSLYEGQMSMTYDEDAPDMQAYALHRNSRWPERIALSIESGVAYQLPGDDARPLNNMFTHLVFRLGYRISAAFEAGVLAGQDAFNEYPGDEVDIERIPDYGGVVAYTFGYLGVYGRFTPGTSFIQPVVQVSGGISDSAPIAEAAAGVRANILPQIEVYLLPSVMMHFRDEISTKIGLHYGATVRF